MTNILKALIRHWGSIRHFLLALFASIRVIHGLINSDIK
jgi:hypothetical protein